MKQIDLANVSLADILAMRKASRKPADKKTAERLIARGIHPFGFAVREPRTETCRTCVHAIPTSLSKTYWKCKQHRITGGSATDLRLSWTACEKWQKGSK